MIDTMYTSVSNTNRNRGVRRPRGPLREEAVVAKVHNTPAAEALLLLVDIGGGGGGARESAAALHSQAQLPHMELADNSCWPSLALSLGVKF